MSRKPTKHQQAQETLAEYDRAVISYQQHFTALVADVCNDGFSPLVGFLYARSQLAAPQETLAVLEARRIAAPAAQVPT